MSRHHRPAAPVLWAALLFATAAAAAVPVPAPVATRADCEIGNLNLPVPPSVPDLITGNEAFAYFVYPLEQCSCSEEGFKLEAVHWMLEVLPDQVPAIFQAYGALNRAVYDPGTGCWLPGPEIYAGPTVDIELLEAGVYDIVLPTPDAFCQQLDNYYFLTVHILTPLTANLVVDGAPMPCIEWNDKGSGWVDMFFMKRPANGKTIIWGDIVCCMPPVGSETPTWGAVKSMYR